MDHKVTYLIFIALMIILNVVSGIEFGGECVCGAFSDPYDLRMSILQQALPYQVSCDENGAVDCQRKCMRLAKAVPIHVAVNMLCHRVGKAMNFPQIHLFAKNCMTGMWKSANYMSPQSICCRDGASVSCNFK